MEPASDSKAKDVTVRDVSEAFPCTSEQSSEADTVSPNEAAVPLAFEELAPHVRVIRPSRPSLTYDRME